MRVYIWGGIIFDLAIENTIVIYDHESVSLRKNDVWFSYRNTIVMYDHEHVRLRKNDLWFGYREHHIDVWSWACKFEEEWFLI